jgi:hypothetical protein
MNSNILLLTLSWVDYGKTERRTVLATFFFLFFIKTLTLSRASRVKVFVNEREDISR